MDFRICDAVAFNLEGNANTLSDHFNSKKAGNADWQFNILAGVSIRFGKGYTENTKGCPDFYPTPERTEGRAERGPETGCRA